MSEPFIERRDGHEWFNWHRTHGVGGKAHALFTPHNQWLGEAPVAPTKRFAPGLAGLQKIAGLAAASGKRIRALGSGWSLSNIAFVDDYLVNTSRLDYFSVGLKPGSVTPAFADRASRIVFAQCGTQITTLNSGLEGRDRERLALPTAGASNGQTIAGAISTGTHGSAHNVGALHDRVRALHIVVDSQRHCLIQPQSAPLLTKAYADWLGAELVESPDDDLFNAALVSFGSFGLIHAVFLEVDQLYLLEMCNRQFDVDDAWQSILRHDVSKLGLPATTNPAHHIEFVLNPYRRAKGQRGAFLRVLYREPYKLGSPLPVLPISGGKTLRAHDLVSAIAVGSDLAPGAIPGILQDQLLSAYTPTHESVVGTPGQHFGDSSPTNGGTSIEIGVPLERLADALTAILSVTDANPFGAPLSVRYVKASNALLAFTHFAPLSCAIEMPGIDAARATTGHTKIEQALRARNVPHTYHWGQALPLNPQQVIDGFGQARVNRWQAARRAFLTPSQRKQFSNNVTDACGLSG